jgi:hypothetical protein
MPDFTEPSNDTPCSCWGPCQHRSIDGGQPCAKHYLTHCWECGIRSDDQTGDDA